MSHSFVITSRLPETSSQFARVEVEPVRVTDRFNRQVLVTGFWLNGPGWPQTEGHKIRKDGTVGSVRNTNLDVRVPDEIRLIMADLLLSSD